MKLRLILFLILGSLSCTGKAETGLPPSPAAYFNDYTSVTDGPTAHTLNEQLAQFDRDTSNQFVVAIFQSLKGADLETFSSQTFQKWGIGQRGKNNGVALFVFIQDRKMRIEVGYGLEGILTDYICSQIIQEKIKPYFKIGDYNGGLKSGVNAIVGTIQGKPLTSSNPIPAHSTPSKVSFTDDPIPSILPYIFLILFILIFIFIVINILRGIFYPYHQTYTSSGWGSDRHSTWYTGGGGGFSGGGGGFSGFSGGGGSSGGGGASGSW